MNNNIYKKLDEGKLFKLIFWLGNTNLDEIDFLTRVYAQANVDMFDITPDVSVIEAVLNALKSIKCSQNDYLFCVSFSFGNDVHGSKICIDKNKCNKCLKCVNICPNKAIANDLTIEKAKCIGCRKCEGCDAISFQKEYQNPAQKLKELKNYKIDCVELHVNGLKKEEIEKIVKDIKNEFPKMPIGICLSKGRQTDKEAIEIVQHISKFIYPQKLIFQADGKPMSGNNDDELSTKDALTFSKLFEKENIYILPSGGCNAQTMRLSKEKGVRINGVAIGSFARFFIKNIIKNKSFCYNNLNIHDVIQKACYLAESIKRWKRLLKLY